MLGQAVADNPLLDDTRCAPDGIKRAGGFAEQIDLVVQLGGLLVVGEIKCLLFPTEPRERFNYMRKLKDAAEQVWRKAAALASRPDIAARALGITEDRASRLRPVPIVVVNQGFGLASEIGGCRVVDAGLVERYLSNSGEVPGSAPFYSSQAEAVAGFEEAMAAPLSLRAALNRLAPAVYVFPTTGPSGLRVTYFAPHGTPMAARLGAATSSDSRLIFSQSDKDSVA